MQVRLVLAVCDEYRRYAVGEICELPDDKAARWIMDGIAEAVEVVPIAAVLPEAPERPTHPRARAREA